MVEQRTDFRLDMTSAQDFSAESVICAHHWQIETPNGETSDASCKHCGATRSFANYSHRRPMTRNTRPPTEPTTRF